MTSDFTSVDGTRFRYEVRGAGPTVLFFHAFPLGMWIYDAQVAALEKTHRTVRFDARGFGGTPPGDGPLTMEKIADDGAALLDGLGLGQAVIVGCSMGGYVALAMARKHRDRVRGLVLLDTRATPDTPEGRAGRSALAERARKEGSRAVAVKFLPALTGPTTRRERPEIEGKLAASILSNPPEGLANALLGMGARADSRSDLPGIRVPTLIVCGEEDTVTPLADSRAMADLVPGSTLVVVPRAGHLANLENPVAVNAALVTFLAGF